MFLVRFGSLRLFLRIYWTWEVVWLLCCVWGRRGTLLWSGFVCGLKLSLLSFSPVEQRVPLPSAVELAHWSRYFWRSPLTSGISYILKISFSKRSLSISSARLSSSLAFYTFSRANSSDSKFFRASSRFDNSDSFSVKFFSLYISSLFFSDSVLDLSLLLAGSICCTFGS